MVVYGTHILLSVKTCGKYLAQVHIVILTAEKVTGDFHETWWVENINELILFHI